MHDPNDVNHRPDVTVVPPKPPDVPNVLVTRPVIIRGTGTFTPPDDEKNVDDRKNG